MVRFNHIPTIFFNDFHHERVMSVGIILVIYEYDSEVRMTNKNIQ